MRTLLTILVLRLQNFHAVAPDGPEQHAGFLEMLSQYARLSDHSVFGRLPAVSKCQLAVDGAEPRLLPSITTCHSFLGECPGG